VQLRLGELGAEGVDLCAASFDLRAQFAVFGHGVLRSDFQLMSDTHVLSVE
jgi:hypothetical protein